MITLMMLALLADTGSAPAYSDHANLLVYHDQSGVEHPVRTRRDWKLRRGHILAHMQDVMGSLPDTDRVAPLEMQVLQEEETPEFTRRKITFAVESGDRLSAYLLIPHGLNGKAPAVLCLHQTTSPGKAEPAGVTGKADLQYAAHLASRGYVTLAPDYPTFGEYMPAGDFEARGYASGTMKGIWNHMRAVDLLASLPEVDAKRIGCIGHSLGGHNTLFLGAFDSRLKALVTNCGFTSFPKYYGGDLTGWTSARYMPRIASVYKKDPKRVPFDFPEVLGAIAPCPLLVIAPDRDDNFDQSGARDCVEAARRVYALLGAGERIDAVYPNCAHEFPASSREAAYAWLDRWLKPNH